MTVQGPVKRPPDGMSHTGGGGGGQYGTTAKEPRAFGTMPHVVVWPHICSGSPRPKGVAAPTHLCLMPRVPSGSRAGHPTAQARPSDVRGWRQWHCLLPEAPPRRHRCSGGMCIPARARCFRCTVIQCVLLRLPVSSVTLPPALPRSTIDRQCAHGMGPSCRGLPVRHMLSSDWTSAADSIHRLGCVHPHQDIDRVSVRRVPRG